VGAAALATAADTFVAQRAISSIAVDRFRHRSLLL